MAVIFILFFVIKTLDPDPELSLKVLDPDPESINPDPEHRYQRISCSTDAHMLQITSVHPCVYTEEMLHCHTYIGALTVQRPHFASFPQLKETKTDNDNLEFFSDSVLIFSS